MSFEHSAYVVFGIHIPREQYQAGGEQHRECEWIDGVIKATPELSGHGVGYLTAGAYDRDELFITVDGDRNDPFYAGPEVAVGTFRVLNPEVPITWVLLLDRLVAAAGYDPASLDRPGWLVVPDVS